LPCCSWRRKLASRDATGRAAGKVVEGRIESKALGASIAERTVKAVSRTRGRAEGTSVNRKLARERKKGYLAAQDPRTGKEKKNLIVIKKDRGLQVRQAKKEKEKSPQKWKGAVTLIKSVKRLRAPRGTGIEP